MSLQVATTLPPGDVLESEVAVVGAGPAGLALAEALAAGGLDVALIETGGLGVSAGRTRDDAPELADEAGGATFRGERRFGGARWYGRCVAPDPIDFECRSWVPDSGWPVPLAELTPFVERAARWLGIERPEALDPAYWRDDAAWRLLDGGGVAPIVHLIAPQRNLGRRARPLVRDSRRIRALLGATLVGFDFAPGSGRVERARFAAADGAERAARARTFVLACGGVENARQLLLFDEAEPGRLGGSAALGAGFFDHPRCDGFARLRLDTAAPAARAAYRKLIEHASGRAGCRVQLALGIAPERQRAEGLLNPCGFFNPMRLRRIAQSDGLLPLLASVARGARGRRQRLAPLDLVEQLEQLPTGAGRIELAVARDRLGRRKARVNWRVGDETRRTQRRFHALLAERLAATGVGRLESPLLADEAARPVYGDAGHPMGATRMSADAARGVVDADSRVHGLENLYVAGTSVFPTSGHANPTLTLVALALRLAAHLAERSRASGARRG